MPILSIAGIFILLTLQSILADDCEHPTACLTDEKYMFDNCAERCSRNGTNCPKFIDWFGREQKFQCHCYDLKECTFKQEDPCTTDRCQDGYDGPTCQIRLYHYFLALEDPKSAFSNATTECQTLPFTYTFKYPLRIHSLTGQGQFPDLKVTSKENKDLPCRTYSPGFGCYGNIYTQEITMTTSKPSTECINPLELLGCPKMLYGKTCLRTCHCEPEGFCELLTGMCPRWKCEPGYFGTSCQLKTFINIAEGQPTNQTSTHHDDTVYIFSPSGDCKPMITEMTSDRAVDGNVDPEIRHQSCSNTNEGGTNSWQVKLDKIRNISLMVIYNINTPKWRFEGFYVSVNSGPNGELVKTFESSGDIHLQGRIVLRFDKPALGDTVTISNLLGRKLTLCEVKVLECKPGYYGYMCQEKCTDCVNTACESYYGECDIACKNGVIWSDEIKRCPRCKAGFYGTLCENNCVNCIRLSCESDHGKCLKGCHIGMDWDDKTKKCEDCPNGYYGFLCDYNCSECLNMSCGNINGECHFGCMSGMEWDEEASKCKECQPGYYGLKCANNCSDCEGMACDSYIGKCENGCIDGMAWDDGIKRCTDANSSIKMMILIIVMILCLFFIGAALAFYAWKKIRDNKQKRKEEEGDEGEEEDEEEEDEEEDEEEEDEEEVSN